MSRPGAAGWIFPYASYFDAFYRCFQAGRNIGPRQADGNVGGQETDFVAAVITRTIGFHRVKRHFADHLGHGVGELDFISGAALLLVENGEDFRLQDIAADDAEIGGFGAGGGLLHHALHLGGVAAFDGAGD